MKRPLFQAHFHETYYYANIIKNVLSNRFNYLQVLEDFYGDEKYLDLTAPFRKQSAFHWFIEFTIDNLISEEAETFDLEKLQARVRRFDSSDPMFSALRSTNLPINETLHRYGLKHQVFEKWLEEAGKTFLEATQDDVSNYYWNLPLEQDNEYSSFMEKAVDETFFILFQNRHILLNFNSMIADQIRHGAIHFDITNEAGENYQAHFAAPGVLKRVSIPSWVKRAVFFRDRGLCTACHCDLSGTLNIGTAEHYDHMVPLARGGLNDVSNMQLLCSNCNLQKHAGNAFTSNYYEAWYPKDTE